jgi:hypothetical protein
MTQDNIYAYASFSVMGGFNYEGECARTLRIFASHEVAINYARDLCNDGFDYAYVMGHDANGVPDLANVVRVADEGPDQVDLSI